MPPLLELLGWAAHYYHHPIGEVFAAALPKALRLGAPAAAREERWLATTAGAAAWAAGEPRRAPKQRALLGLLAAGPVTAAELDERAGSWRDGGARAPGTRLHRRVPRSRRSVRPAVPRCARPALSSPPNRRPPSRRSQRDWARLGTFLLHGITGSGKTEVYLRLVERVLQRGRRALVLVPEIGLTPQLVGALPRSASPRRSRCCTPRSPTPNASRRGAPPSAARRASCSARARRCSRRSPELGLIVVDEEHDASFKQHEGGFRYSARDLAVMRAQRGRRAGACWAPRRPRSRRCTTSAPAATRAWRCRGAPRQAQPPRAAAHRPARPRACAPASPLPRCAPMRAPPRRRTARCWCSSTGAATRRRCCARPAAGSRPAATAMRASRCTWRRGRLRCHHCGADAPLPQRCPQCGFAVKPVGQGTERVEETLAKLFPGVALRAWIATWCAAAATWRT